jgi:nitroreductase
LSVEENIMATHTVDRASAHEILPQFTARWSSRAFAPTALDEAQLFRVLEAARWAPSGSNTQPWRFVYALRGTPEFARFLELMVPFNRSWAAHAGALVALVSTDTLPDGRPHPSHAFDAGAAWMSLALQAHAMGRHRRLRSHRCPGRPRPACGLRAAGADRARPPRRSRRAARRAFDARAPE